ncbi:precorrin-6A synthase (deacetylating) [Thauera linaloolentis]|uniref:Precorrin 6A synthase n=1 Tax=Thauera linaloolentis (strain DSM 12138 / JCM 21573 / CCUG 41526 / CIP 105981 / IAM 15112 / NBRC 102519 / 47Lol) TaxID=1123367 RepID=N6XZM7_THAL4|nr:precorrin-6A synthase (deacetylating) [Thauera linaloolentis]ENO84720.1 precorrin 6A synthase [Thauera linaloolentis 47Lol = DSM 12138]MCM8567421.1 precorrin-6A synthase (deacetylating) [Thauera linaloolentis]
MADTLELHLVGIGTGNPEHLTLAAVRALDAADLILLPRKGEDKVELLDLRRDICTRLLNGHARIAEFDLPLRAADGDYLAAVADWHDAIAAEWRRQIDAHLPAGGGKVALLVWGDPSLYDSSLRIATRLGAVGGAPRVHVVPGITAVQALTAAHGIPLNDLAAPVVITTGRRLREGGWPAGADTVVVMLDSGGAFQAVDADGVGIWWGAYLGMPQQALVAGALGEVAGDILRERARLRQAHGWIMDVYLMRRGPGG